MKNYTKSFWVICLSICWTASSAQNSRNYSVLTWASTSDNPASISIHFEDDPLATSYQIYRKDLGTTGWGSPIATLSGGGTGDITHEDKNVVTNKSYEYFVFKKGSGSFEGYGYLNAGINLDATHDRGSILLIIDKEASDSLGPDLNQLRADLAGDGYNVLDYIVDSSVKHETIKDQISSLKKLQPDLNSIYIFGHVAVPYSGKYCNDNVWTVPPDGHKPGSGDHCGAWAADVYYAVPEGTWTDVDTVDYGASRAWNKNFVGDGKFDQIVIPAEAKYQLGRVDLNNLTAFSKSEFELLKQYIEKSHDYRYANKKPYMKALIEENFGASVESFGGNGYRNFSAMVGRDNMQIADLMETSADSTFIWANASGAGSFTSARGVGNTADFASKQGAAIFNFIFGSFFGDWDNKNAFLRAPLAVENGGLTNAWAGRPWWHTHPMAFNQTIGYCTRLVQNNGAEYITGFFQKNIHIALMGDPTLRMHMFEPPSNFTATPSIDKTEVNLSWTASIASVDGYNLYVSTSPYGPYGQINADLITGTTYTHNSMGNGTYYYMVRAQRLENTLSGSFHNLSQGMMKKVDNLLMSSVNDILTSVSILNIYPNPSNGTVQLSFDANNGGLTQISVIDMQGRQVYSNISRGLGLQIVPINLSHLSAGMYVAQVNGNSLKFVIK
jgi:Secretion system C-terminal sorting domain